MIDHTARRSQRPRFPTEWQMAIPVEQEEREFEHGALTRDIADSPAFHRIVEYLKHAKSLGFDPKAPSILKRAVKAGNASYAEELSRKAHAESFVHLKGPHKERSHSPIVYYVRRGDLVKIGYTTRLKMRVSQIEPEGVMAVEPGGAPVETKRHEQFASSHHHREWFTMTPDLMHHIVELRAKFLAELGEPVDAWVARNVAPTSPAKRMPSGSVTTRPKLPILQPGHDEVLGEVVTTAEAAAAVGRPMTTVHGWRYRGHIAPVGKTFDRAYLYRLSDVMAASARVGRSRAA